MTKEIVQQILQTKVELETNQVKFPDFKKVVEDIDSQVFTIDELKESFENKGLADVLSNSSKLNQMIDHFLPEQSGYGIFCPEHMLCVGHVWCSGIDILKSIREQQEMTEYI